MSEMKAWKLEWLGYFIRKKHDGVLKKTLNPKVVEIQKNLNGWYDDDVEKYLIKLASRDGEWRHRREKNSRKLLGRLRLNSKRRDAKKEEEEFDP